MKLALERVTCGYPGKTLLRGLSLHLGSGEILCILGPNGVGKTTLFKTLLGFFPLQGGTISIDGADIRNWPRKRLAAVMGYVPQAHAPVFPFSVADVVLMGRTARLGMFASPGKRDRGIAARALETLGIGHLFHRVYTEISGGEQQMVLIARALAQGPRFLIMDEPTAHLDFGNQVRVLQQIRRLATLGIGIVMTTHAPNHALLCSSRVILIQRQGHYKTGSAEEIVSEKNMRETYGVNVRLSAVLNENGTEIKTCTPLLEQESWQGSFSEAV